MIAVICRCVSFPTLSVSWLRSRATINETFATESFGRPVKDDFNSTLPGASAHFILLVNGTHTTVPILLWFTASHWTTTTGRRNPAEDPVGSSRSAQRTSPWLTTIPHAAMLGLQPSEKICGLLVPNLQEHDSWPPWSCHLHVEPRNSLKLVRIIDCVMCGVGVQGVRPVQIHRRVWILLLSYR